MVNYKNGKIYKLVTDKDPSLVYIGSTTSTLSRRKSGHKNNFIRWQSSGCGNYVTSFDVFKCDNNPTIVLIERCTCSTKEELLKRERYWIERLTCVNKNIPGRTDTEYWKDNREKYLAKKKRHYNKHKDQYLKKSQQKYNITKHHISNDKYLCVCGSYIRTFGRPRHERTKKHQTFINK